eukprot:g28968.t1
MIPWRAAVALGTRHRALNWHTASARGLHCLRSKAEGSHAGWTGRCSSTAESQVQAVVQQPETESPPQAFQEAEIPPEVSELFETLRGEALRRLDDFLPIHLFSLCWAYSTARLLDEDLQRNITRAALRLGRSRDASGAQDSDGMEAPRILKATEHWMAILKPAHWQVSVDAKEAARMGSSSPFEEDEDAEEEPEKPRVQAWIRKHMSRTYPPLGNTSGSFDVFNRASAARLRPWDAAPMSKPQVSLAVMGPSQCGKTTALGKLCALSGAFEEDLAWELGRPGYSHGWMLDRLPEERELGSTLTSHMQRFESAHCSYCAFDTPGREARSSSKARGGVGHQNG